MSAEPDKLRSSFRPRSILKMLAGLLLAALAFMLLAGRAKELSGASTKLAHSDWRWFLLALLAEALSFASYAILQRRLLQSSGTKVRFAPLFWLTMATTAIANSLPGEPAFSSAYRFQQYRRNGADTAGASWVVLALLVSSAIGLSLLLLGGVLTAAATSSGYELRSASIVGAIVIVGAGAILVQRDLLARIAGRILTFLHRATGHPKAGALERLETSIDQLRSLEVGRLELASAVSWALLTWILDGICLGASFKAVGAPISWEIMPLAYGVSQIAAVIPVMPGGLGLVEGSITSVLVAYGQSRVPTLAAVLAYRIIEYWLTIPLGWLAFAGISYGWRRSNRMAPNSCESSPSAREKSTANNDQTTQTGDFREGEG